MCVSQQTIERLSTFSCTRFTAREDACLASSPCPRPSATVKSRPSAPRANAASSPLDPLAGIRPAVDAYTPAARRVRAKLARANAGALAAAHVEVQLVGQLVRGGEADAETSLPLRVRIEGSRDVHDAVALVGRHHLDALLPLSRSGANDDGPSPSCVDELVLRQLARDVDERRSLHRVEAHPRRFLADPFAHERDRSGVDDGYRVPVPQPRVEGAQ